LPDEVYTGVVRGACSVKSSNWFHATRNTQYALSIVLAFVVLSSVYSVVTPLFEGPDEIWHFAFANHLADGGGLPVFDAAQPATFLRNGAHPPVYYALIAVLIAPLDRSDFPAEFRFNLANPLITQGASGTSRNLLIHTAHEDWPWRNTALAAHLARFVSIALNALALWGVWQIARRIVRDERLAILALALAAFVPQFVYGAAMINNDALAAATATWLVYALLRWFDAPTLKWAAISGVMLGLALLSKIGLIALLPVPLLALGLYAIRTTHHAPRHWRQLILAVLIIYGLAVIIAGWWYVRNWQLYGDPLAWREWQALTGAGRVPPTFGDFIGDLIGMFGLFWIDFSLRIDRTWWPIFGVIVLAALIGLIRRALKREWPLDWAKLLIALSVFALLLASAVRYSFNIYDIHGRLLYPSLAAIGVVLALGLSKWPKSITFSLGAIPLIFTLVSPLMIIQPAYARPIVSALPDGVIPASAQFGDVELAGYRVVNERVKAGEAVEIVTYWRRTTPVTASDQSTLRAIINLATPGTGASLGRGEAALGNDVYPSWAWALTEMVATRVTVVAQADASTVGDVRLGVRGDSAALIPSGQGETIGLGRIAVSAPRPCNSVTSVDRTFNGSIKLLGYRLEANTLVLCWQSIKPVVVDYTVFVHITDTAGQPSSADAPPRGGAYPTSAWQAGEQVDDTHALPVAADLIQKISIGFYRLDTGERLIIDGTNDTEFIIQHEP